MIKYEIEEGINSFNLFLKDDDNNVKVLIAVIFNDVHARIINRKMNEYVTSSAKS
ncbi:hypothetical protein M5X00_17965 [Paenibacillus alvei]|uniref:Uncharacterized protein n=1 Tax=Paenibacillus alvei TaxID=44250 RepID=A0AAP7A4K1_PAEAL|nr:hypothetical protein [Paenibacillus alvei]MCY7484934.1 hypothetical protein [Paenibacillus alvei]MCY9540903.1 hypothetical protein [Paenibacillus alvei]MCY9580901.1 hypothetical protein [Paenibacillus alvei]MCY9585619.1 hypothetical protein [Paenibacillus alvei]MCY9705105.1 hypothetical protein [Paenibacillus alvei]